MPEAISSFSFTSGPVNILYGAVAVTVGFKPKTRVSTVSTSRPPAFSTENGTAVTRLYAVPAMYARSPLSAKPVSVCTGPVQVLFQASRPL
ncbi:MAG: hypothetical protein HY291_09955 [Planctomycetes bacterium]|nr:hypothetical protein [Planctomycetota bacterium]